MLAWLIETVSNKGVPASEMGKVPVTEPADLSLMSQIHMAEGKNQLLKVIVCPLCAQTTNTAERSTWVDLALERQGQQVLPAAGLLFLKCHQDSSP